MRIAGQVLFMAGGLMAAFDIGTFDQVVIVGLIGLHLRLTAMEWDSNRRG